MKITVLGSGTSAGVPVIGCECPTCTSDDPKDKRLRPSIMLETDTQRFIFDTTPDFRQQVLQHNVKELDAIIYTHHHIDHIGGFDDIRGFNFRRQAPLPIYIMQETFDHLKRAFLYAFGGAIQQGGGLPSADVHIIDEEPFSIGNCTFQPIPMWHGKMRVNGYRIGDFAYCTDTNYIPDSSLRKLRGVKTLILDALRFHPHPTHFTIGEALSLAKKIGAERTYFTHISCFIRHQYVSQILPSGVELCYDNLVINV